MIVISTDRVVLCIGKKSVIVSQVGHSIAPKATSASAASANAASASP